MSGPKSWYIGPALLALGRFVGESRTEFDEHKLSHWADDDQLEFSPATARQALERLRSFGYISQQNNRRKSGGTQRWTLTPEGLQACTAARAALVEITRPNPNSLATRLWNLLRIRRRLTSDEAASLLFDAGVGNFASHKKQIGEQLRAWQKFSPGVVTTAEKREAGHIRYVLVSDIGRWPPPARAGEIHPSEFDNLAPIPSRFLKPIATSTDTAATHGEKAHAQ